MKVLLLGKPPSCQGGTALETLRFARQMVGRGHSVTFLTNSCDFEKNYRYRLNEADNTRLDGQLSGIDLVELDDLPKGSFIPFSLSPETRLLGRGLQHALGADAVVGWYYQPYGVVASIIGSELGLPTFLVHAGSDLGRLALNSDLHEAYQWALSKCHIVTHGPATASKLLEIFENVDSSKVISLARGTRLYSWLTRRGPKFDFAAEGYLVRDWYSDVPSIRNALDDINQPRVLSSEEHSQITIYGKVGQAKGTFALLQSVERLIRTGRKVQLNLTLGGHIGPMLRVIRLVGQSKELMGATRLLPFMPPWKIASLVRSSDIACFLEHSFDVEFHNPNVPREILSIGTPLVCSREVTEKYKRYLELQDSQHLTVIEDPSDIAELTGKLAVLLDDTDGRHYRSMAAMSLVKSHNLGLPDCDPLCLRIEELASR